MHDIEIELLPTGSGHRLGDVDPDVFDEPIEPERVEELLTEEDNVAALALYERTGGRRLVPDPVMFEFSLEREP